MILNGKDVIIMDLETAENLLKVMNTLMGDSLKASYLKLIKKGLLTDFDKFKSLIKELKE